MLKRQKLEKDIRKICSEVGKENSEKELLQMIRVLRRNHC